VNDETAEKLRDMREELEYLAASEYRLSKVSQDLLDALDEHDSEGGS